MDEEVLFVMFLLGVSALVAGMGVALLFMRKELRRLRGQAEVPPSSVRMDRLEQAVDAIAVQVERLADDQQYTARLLAERRQREVFPTRLPPSSE